jgi:alpha-1,6-mannosyl-glycoprotein beta-1,2-N-acetylglucosaminyltransferase
MMLAGLVLFLEEDHFVAQDFLHILRLMERTARTSCPTCNILSLGTYLKTYNYFGDSKKVCHVVPHFGISSV